MNITDFRELRAHFPKNSNANPNDEGTAPYYTTAVPNPIETQIKHKPNHVTPNKNHDPTIHTQTQLSPKKPSAPKVLAHISPHTASFAPNPSIPTKQADSTAAARVMLQLATQTSSLKHPLMQRHNQNTVAVPSKTNNPIVAALKRKLPILPTTIADKAI